MQAIPYPYIHHLAQLGARMSSVTTNDVKSATTGLDWMLNLDMKPGVAYNDPGTVDLIDAPDWVPTGSHRSVCCVVTGRTIVFGETGRPGRL